MSFFVSKNIKKITYFRYQYLSLVMFWKSSHALCIWLRAKYKMYKMETVFHISISYGNKTKFAGERQKAIETRAGGYSNSQITPRTYHYPCAFSFLVKILRALCFYLRWCEPWGTLIYKSRVKKKALFFFPSFLSFHFLNAIKSNFILFPQNYGNTRESSE